jgi:putative hydrolase of the HAD superfamily
MEIFRPSNKRMKFEEYCTFELMVLDKKEAIIFDLGGVVLNLDYQLTENAFVALGLQNFKDVYSQLAQNDLFDRLERGEISGFHFINRLLDQLPAGCNANQVVHAWNAMVLNFPTERLAFIQTLRQHFRVVLLSNTNELHMYAVKRSLYRAVGHDRLEEFFDSVYLSHELGMRKPDPAIFIKVCELEGNNPASTLFIDDSEQHVIGARSAGLNAILLKKGEEIQSILS